MTRKVIWNELDVGGTTLNMHHIKNLPQQMMT